MAPVNFAFATGSARMGPAAVASAFAFSNQGAFSSEESAFHLSAIWPVAAPNAARDDAGVVGASAASLAAAAAAAAAAATPTGIARVRQP